MSNNNSPWATPSHSPTKKPCDHNEAHENTEEMSSDRPFDIHVVNASFEGSLAGENDVYLYNYASAYHELNKMFPLLGRLFSFVQKDVEEKTQILMKLHAANKDGYETVGKMITTECGDSSKPQELGCRTLLRLHRALEFIVHFVRHIHQSGHDDKISHVGRAAYDETLAQHHPWLIRKGVHVALYALPHRKQLLIDLSGSTADKFDEAVADRALVELVDRAQAVYDRIQKFYVEKGLLNLP